MHWLVLVLIKLSPGHVILEQTAVLLRFNSGQRYHKNLVRRNVLLNCSLLKIFTCMQSSFEHVHPKIWSRTPKSWVGHHKDTLSLWGLAAQVKLRGLALETRFTGLLSTNSN